MVWFLCFNIILYVLNINSYVQCSILPASLTARSTLSFFTVVIHLSIDAIVRQRKSFGSIHLTLHFISIVTVQTNDLVSLPRYSDMETGGDTSHSHANGSVALPLWLPSEAQVAHLLKTYAGYLQHWLYTAALVVAGSVKILCHA